MSQYIIVLQIPWQNWQQDIRGFRRGGGKEYLPKSSTFPPRLLSSARGALHVGQYCDSNSLIYS